MRPRGYLAGTIQSGQGTRQWKMAPPDLPVWRCMACPPVRLAVYNTDKSKVLTVA